MVTWDVRATMTLLLIGACSFRPGTTAQDALPPNDVARIDSPGDAPGDVPVGPTACVQHWLTGPTLGTPSLLANVNGTSPEGDPWLTPDERTIYFVLNGDIYRSTRASVSASFGAPVLDTNLSTLSYESKISFTADGRTAFINANWPGSASTDVWRGTRATVADQLTFDRMFLTLVNTINDEWDPHISGDGLHLYLAPYQAGQHIAVASRATATVELSAPVMIPSLMSASNDSDPTVSLDDRVLVFASDRTGNDGLWYAVRQDPAGSFGAPVELAATNTSSAYGPHLSADGCRLYFASTRTGNGDIYVVDVM